MAVSPRNVVSSGALFGNVPVAGTMKPTVSVIVAVRNAVSTVERTLHSVLGQAYPNIELIVVDGVSTDGTLQVMEKFSGSIAKFISEPDRGIADAYNKGIRLAAGDWIHFLNADDVYFSADTLNHVFSDPRASSQELIVGKVLADDGRVIDGRFSWKLLMRNRVHHQAIFYRRELIQRLMYNADYRRYGHDHEHNLLLWRLGIRPLYLSETIAIWNSGGISNNATWKDYREEFRVRRNAIGKAAWMWNGFTISRYLMKRAKKKLRSLSVHG